MGKKGFTLTEILVVVVIIAVVAALAMPGLVKTIEKAKVSEAISNLELIRNAQKRYFIANGEFTPDIDSLPIENPNNTAVRYFDYTIRSADPPDFTARAQRRSTAPSPYNTYYYEITKDGTITSNGPLI